MSEVFRNLILTHITEMSLKNAVNIFETNCSFLNVISVPFDLFGLLTMFIHF